MGRLSLTAETSASDPGTEAQTPHNLQLRPHNSVEPPLERPRGPALFGTPAAVALSPRTLARPQTTRLLGRFGPFSPRKFRKTWRFNQQQQL